MFRLWLVAAPLLLAVLLGRGDCGTAFVEVLLPDDPSFSKYSFAYLSINGVDRIDSVSSSMAPDKFDADQSSIPNQIVFKADVPAGTYSIQAVSGPDTHQLTLRVSRLPISVVDQAVFIRGTTSSVNSFLTRLSNCIRLSLVTESITEAAVLIPTPHIRDRTFMSLWDAYDLIKNETVGTAIEVMPDRCTSVSGQMCRSRLSFSRGFASVRRAVVQLGSNDSLLGFELSLVAQTAEQMAAEPCLPTTCLNGGYCDPNFVGVGFRCICPVSPDIQWGPRCEYPVRSYSTSGAGFAYIRHWIGGLPRSSQSLSISFEMVGTTDSEKNEIVALTSSTNPSAHLLNFGLIAGTRTLKVSGSLIGGNSLEISANQLNIGSWFAVFFLLTSAKSTLVICPKSLPILDGSTDPLKCYQAESGSGGLIADFSNVWLEVGKYYSGCVQAVSVNGYRADMAASRTIVVAPAEVRNYCSQSSCTSMGSQPVCGNHSACYGVYKPGVAPIECYCRCLGSKRKSVERVTLSGQCDANNLQSNLCIKSPLVISTGAASDGTSTWHLNPADSLTVPDVNSATIEMELRTRVASASGVLNAKITDRVGATVINESLDIARGFLQLCVGGISQCFQFPPIRVDDGEWHSVSAATHVRMLILKIDSVTLLHDLGFNMTGIERLDLTAKIANSLLRNIRVSGTYMSTTANETDQSRDSPAGPAIIPRLASGATVGIEGVDPAPPCNCTSNEICKKQWGKTTCECPAGQDKDASNSCVAVSPCKQFNISCPSGGSCQPIAVDPGFECLCPPGVSSRMCRVGGQSTSAPATAAVQWWVWLITAIAALLILLVLIFIIYFVRRPSEKSKTVAFSRGVGDDIEKIHEGMGESSDNDGVPPEDYNGPLSLHFPPQKDSNGGLPNFQPVQTATPATAPVRTLNPPVTTDEVPDPSGDETLNYGYEDTRDDDASDLDRVSLVSVDTDLSMDLKPTLDAWGPKFKPLADILT